MVGTLAYAAEGDMIEASGHMTEHPVYGEQLQIESYEMKTPQDELSMERYLGSGAIKGIGAALAARICLLYTSCFMTLIILGFAGKCNLPCDNFVNQHPLLVRRAGQVDARGFNAFMPHKVGQK